MNICLAERESALRLLHCEVGQVQNLPWMSMAPASGPVSGLEGAIVLVLRPHKRAALYIE